MRVTKEEYQITATLFALTKIAEHRYVDDFFHVMSMPESEALYALRQKRFPYSYLILFSDK